MATWQFSVVLIPASWVEENSYSSSLLYDEEGYDTECAWKDRQPDSKYKNVLGEILPPSKWLKQPKPSIVPFSFQSLAQWLKLTSLN